MPRLVDVRVPQWTGVLRGRELHVFVGAEKTYAAAVYLRGLGLSSEWQLSLLIAKTKMTQVEVGSTARTV